MGELPHRSKWWTCSVHDRVACVGLAKVFIVFFFWLLIPVEVHSFLDWKSMHQHLSSSGDKFPYPLRSICIGNIRNYHHLKCDWRVIQWYRYPCRFVIAEAGCFPAVHSSWKDGVMGCQTWWHRMHVSLQNEGVTRNLGEDMFGSQNHGMIPKWVPSILPSCSI